LDFNAKWFIIGIIVGAFIMFMFAVVLFLVEPPYETIEQVCYNDTYSEREYQECVEKLRNS
jgi:capsular polysaccharide biosynthesis protein